VWYLNASSDNTGTKTWSIPNVSTSARLGSWNHATARELNGGLGEIRVYNRALSATEVSQNFNATRSKYGV